MRDKKDGDQKASEETPRSEPHKKPDRDGEVAGQSVVDPPPSDGKTRGGDDPPVGSVR